ncbi:putative transcriptional regulator, LysR-family [Corynebacterium glutamicum MB001]|uniref:Transcriptional regulator n=1 Tax=Corynebacterium glutamicum (strain ATCC 13032 / DSM 20300 / JCM 1318 / BCRC 11384 / CCUG 27702 / LMG 3730 / NBRC 12168 / NCIMB 10025 / NRRL B-2784 / 534) TaxID=196627 RepID=Q8NTT1_CORGL|nr:LysR family transcriptional regulator [Corynebacterium glutamicum]AGT04232.1 putative transcriptional regulator, LysR-family [Corynebacterium glutamicum MB001]ARV65525.1 LysR family transcriptional regulator [Corynebacterium glutamicum]ASW13011.1 putative transcriptional regulator, LysR-family [Corynebacterium glutamicum]AUH99847.1 LysR family transcriptional regulator [Corynebacterium glutamicum]AUI03485.1 LysR family transcriptional regulator [Corynebacterium glutamicum]
MTKRLSLEGLRYAQAVAETHSFSAAAREYGVTQPALSNGIAKLEDRLGEQLFDRSTQGVTPTSFGLHILPLIQRALTEIDAITAEAHRLINSEARSIRVGISPLINPQLVARTYTAVRELPTAHDLVLREANMKELHEGLLAGELNVILIPAVKPLPHFEHRIIDSEPVVIVESTQDSTDPIELRETQHEPFILVPDTCGLTTFTNQLFETNDLALNAYSGEAASYQVLEQWATLGLGSAMLPLSKLSSPTAPH